MLELFLYGPVLRGFLVLLISGFAFPITGVYLLRMNLLPLRFMLMHGALLGGAVALAMHFNPFWTTMLVNLLLVWFMAKTARGLKTDMGYISIFIMVAAVGLAFALISVFNVQAKDTMSLLWGSIFTVTPLQSVGFISIALFVVGFHLLKYRQLKAVFFDPSVAYSSGINEKRIYDAVVLITALTVAVAMKLIGALLIDTIIILPAIISTLHAKSFKSVVVWASVWGGLFSLGGFFAAYWLKVPTSSAIALIATVVFLIIYFRKKRKS
ncbi:MAG TPA: metal ABC transporter permease [Prolixibacteraceae bacterium]|nr:metal ABC transporter permease [Prolixibacteraceae bacterium]